MNEQESREAFERFFSHPSVARITIGKRSYYEDPKTQAFWIIAALFVEYAELMEFLRKRNERAKID